MSIHLEQSRTQGQEDDACRGCASAGGGGRALARMNEARAAGLLMMLCACAV